MRSIGIVHPLVPSAETRVAMVARNCISSVRFGPSSNVSLDCSGQSYRCREDAVQQRHPYKLSSPHRSLRNIVKSTVKATIVATAPIMSSRRRRQFVRRAVPLFALTHPDQRVHRLGEVGCNGAEKPRRQLPAHAESRACVIELATYVREATSGIPTWTSAQPSDGPNCWA